MIKIFDYYFADSTDNIVLNDEYVLNIADKTDELKEEQPPEKSVIGDESEGVEICVTQTDGKLCHLMFSWTGMTLTEQNISPLWIENWILPWNCTARYQKHRAYHSWQLVFRNPPDFMKSGGFQQVKSVRNPADFTWNPPDFMNVSFWVITKYRSFFRKTNNWMHDWDFACIKHNLFSR